MCGWWLGGGDPDTVGGLVHEWLDALIAYDHANHADFVNTLAVLLDSGGNQVATAETLGVHVSTVKYRMGRIAEVSGFDLSDPDVRLHLHLATRAWRLLGSL